ncbi:MAG: hypothetical protein ACFE9A_09035, partial [Candidatus Hodarchaeota archaeon]
MSKRISGKSFQRIVYCGLILLFLVQSIQAICAVEVDVSHIQNADNAKSKAASEKAYFQDIHNRNIKAAAEPTCQQDLGGVKFKISSEGT